MVLPLRVIRLVFATWMPPPFQTPIGPGLIVGDEPTGDLDREAGDQILGLLEELSSNHGKTVVMVTHDARAAEAAERTLHLDKGQLVESGEVTSPAEPTSTRATVQ